MPRTMTCRSILNHLNFRRYAPLSLLPKTQPSALVGWKRPQYRALRQALGLCGWVQLTQRTALRNIQLSRPLKTLDAMLMRK